MSDKLKSIFEKTLPPHLYVVDSEVTVESLRKFVETFRYSLLYLDGTAITSGGTFISMLEKALPGSKVGQNWNAAYDILTDIHYFLPSQQGYVLFYQDIQNFAVKDKVHFALAIKIMQNAIDYWRETDTPLYILLKGDHSIVPDLTRL